tara:strand:+ start:4762 stop:5547 length:786 start_codon:yes stop_codon:yes gene_type:complete
MPSHNDFDVDDLLEDIPTGDYQDFYTPATFEDMDELGLSSTIDLILGEGATEDLTSQGFFEAYDPMAEQLATLKRIEGTDAAKRGFESVLDSAFSETGTAIRSSAAEARQDRFGLGFDPVDPLTPKYGNILSQRRDLATQELDDDLIGLAIDEALAIDTAQQTYSDYVLGLVANLQADYTPPGDGDDEEETETITQPMDYNLVNTNDLILLLDSLTDYDQFYLNTIGQAEMAQIAANAGLTWDQVGSLFPGYYSLYFDTGS